MQALLFSLIGILGRFDKSDISRQDYCLLLVCRSYAVQVVAIYTNYSLSQMSVYTPQEMLSIAESDLCKSPEFLVDIMKLNQEYVSDFGIQDPNDPMT